MIKLRSSVAIGVLVLLMIMSLEYGGDININLNTEVNTGVRGKIINNSGSGLTFYFYDSFDSSYRKSVYVSPYSERYVNIRRGRYIVEVRRGGRKVADRTFNIKGNKFYYRGDYIGWYLDYRSIWNLYGRGGS